MYLPNFFMETSWGDGLQQDREISGLRYFLIFFTSGLVGTSGCKLVPFQTLIQYSK